MGSTPNTDYSDYGQMAIYNLDERNDIFGSKSPYGQFTSDMTRTPNKALDINKFFILAGLCLTDYYDSHKIIESERFIYVPYSPKFLKEESVQTGKSFNFVVYSLGSRRPPHLPTGRARTAPFVFDRNVDPMFPGYKVRESMVMRDNVVNFDIVCNNFPVSNEYALWFEAVFIPMYTGTFQAHGFPHVVFERREEDRVDAMFGDIVYSKKLVYSVQTQTITVGQVKTVESMKHTYEIASQEGMRQ